MEARHSFADSGRLLARIVHAVQREERITFLFGSALTAPGGQHDELGVPDASSMIEAVFDTFRGSDEFTTIQKVIQKSSSTERYQEAMRFMIECRGQDALNELIQGAVLKARLLPHKQGQTLEEIELDTAGWHLRPAVEAVGRLVVENPRSFSAPILTSNFDPLLEVSLRKAGGNPMAFLITADGHFGNVFAPGTYKVVHFHGYWQGSDTLHTPAQLTRNRPRLKSSLRSLLRDTIVVVVGYGGWSDVFTKTLVEVIGEQNEQLNVLWTFYSDNETEICNRNEHLLASFESLAGQRVVLYKGVDCHVFLPTLRQKLLQSPSEKPCVTTESRSLFSSITAPAPDLTASGDNPPQSPTWVGREEELRVILSSQAKVIAITGLGGIGKSTLAAKYVSIKQSAGEISTFYWADCKEQGNTLHTQLVRMVERVSNGKLRGAQLQESSADDVIDVLLGLLTETRAVLVFDNIDQYVDVEQGIAVGTMNLLMERVLRKTHMAQFVLTTRPRLDYSHPSFLQLQLVGLTLDETRRLFDTCGAALDIETRAQTIAELHELTSGHALTLNLIATQVANNRADARTLVAKLRKNAEAGIENPAFPEIWNSLNPKQQTILRYLAEQPHPDPEQRVASYLGNVLNYNQFSKAVRTLRALNLVVVKSPGGGLEDTLELHPLIRDYIRRRFPPEERIPYMDSILRFYDQMIKKLRGNIAIAPYKILEIWIGKIELSLQRGLPEEALETLAEVVGPLQRGGYSEEFVRLATSVLDGFVPDEKRHKSQSDYDAVFEELVSTTAELGRFDQADLWLERFQDTLVGKTARYILFCAMKAYRFWVQGDMREALNWATQGVALKSSANLDTRHDCGHILALAQRDSGETVHALKFFLEGESLEMVIQPGTFLKNHSGSFYGNIGRCLQLQGENNAALACMTKSAKLLEQARDASVLTNQGYAALWIGKIFQEQQDYQKAYFAYRRAYYKWKHTFPAKASEALNAAEKIGLQIPGFNLEMSDEECDQAFCAWLKAT